MKLIALILFVVPNVLCKNLVSDRQNSSDIEPMSIESCITNFYEDKSECKNNVFDDIECLRTVTRKYYECLYTLINDGYLSNELQMYKADILNYLEASKWRTLAKKPRLIGGLLATALSCFVGFTKLMVPCFKSSTEGAINCITDGLPDVGIPCALGLLGGLLAPI